MLVNHHSNWYTPRNYNLGVVSAIRVNHSYKIESSFYTLCDDALVTTPYHQAHI